MFYSVFIYKEERHVLRGGVERLLARPWRVCQRVIEAAVANSGVVDIQQAVVAPLRQLT